LKVLKPLEKNSKVYSTGTSIVVEDLAEFPRIPFPLLEKIKEIYLILPCEPEEIKEYLRGKKNEEVGKLELPPDIKFWGELFIRGVKEGWGDIFLSARPNNQYEIAVRNKIGLIQTLKTYPDEIVVPELRKLIVLTGKVSETKLNLPIPIDASLNYKDPDSLKDKNSDLYKLFKYLKQYKAEADFRIAIAPTIFGKRVTIRILPKNREIKSLEKLGYSEKIIKRITALTKLKQGLVIVSGPTGSGKSTLLYAIMLMLKKLNRSIVSVEEPVEAVVVGVDQVQVVRPVYNEKGELVGIDFALAIRNFLRQNPDVIVVGETRDKETAKNVLKASNTGHLVLTTVHANDEVSTIKRMADLVGEDNFAVVKELIEELKAVIAQRLVRTLCPRCKKEGRIKKVTVDQNFLQTLPSNVRYYLRDLEGKEIYLAPDPNNTCGQCLNGYSGRKPVIGIFELNRELQDYLIEKKLQVSRRELEMKAKSNYIPMWRNALDKLVEGEIDVNTFAEII